jgi:GNAT superfamily N-acetyltransferase
MYQILEDNGENIEGKNQVIAGLKQYNRNYIPEHLRDQYQVVNYYVQDEESGQVCGGMIGRNFWDIFAIDILWLDEKLRKHGYGSKLIQMAEDKARELKCSMIKLDTLSFQALGFYQKHGFEVYGQIEGVAGEYTHYYLVKKL